MDHFLPPTNGLSKDSFILWKEGGLLTNDDSHWARWSLSPVQQKKRSFITAEHAPSTFFFFISYYIYIYIFVSSHPLYQFIDRLADKNAPVCVLPIMQSNSIEFPRPSKLIWISIKNKHNAKKSDSSAITWHFLNIQQVWGHLFFSSQRTQARQGNRIAIVGVSLFLSLCSQSSLLFSAPLYFYLLIYSSLSFTGRQSWLVASSWTQLECHSHNI